MIVIVSHNTVTVIKVYVLIYCYWHILNDFRFPGQADGSSQGGRGGQGGGQGGAQFEDPDDDLYS